MANDMTDEHAGDRAPQRPDGLLRLRATDREDLAVLSSMLQDAICAVRDLTFMAVERRFVFVANRFRWEEGRRGRERILSAIEVHRVTGVRRQGFHRGEEDRLLSLLVLTVPQSGTIDATFAGNAALRLSVDGIDVRLRDLGEAWPTAWRPEHPEDGDPAGTT